MEEDNNNQNKKRKEHLFSFAKINKYFIFPFLCPIFCFLANLFISFISKDNGLNNKEFLFSLLIHLSYIGGGLLYFISSIRTKREKNDKIGKESIAYRESSFSQIIYIHNDSSNKNKLYKFIILLIISILLVISTISGLYIGDKNVFEDRLYFYFFIPLFSKYILKIKIFNHQILSLLIAFIGLILLFIPSILVIKEEHIIIYIIMFITSIGYSLLLVLCKYLTHNYYMSPYLCILFIGIISTIITIIGYLIYSLIINHNLDIIIDSFNFSKIETKGIILGLYFLSAFLITLIFQVLTILIIYYFSPTLYTVTDIISPLLTWIVNCIQNGENKINIILNSLGFSIVFFSSLIYNEIIICNFLGLNVNVKKFIEERQKEELISLRVTESEIQNGNQQQNEHENNTSSDTEQESN